MAFAVFAEGDKVVLDLGGRRRDLLVSCSQAEKLEHELQRCAKIAEKALPELIKGEVWDVRAESYDGFVALRFIPPLTGNAARVPVPFAVARQLADLVRFKRQQAAWKMRFAFQNKKN